MASKRMFALDIVDTDDFLDMPAGARLLYFDLGMRADDHGMVGDAKKIMRFSGAAADDMKVLIAKGYVIPFDSGVIAITHWHTNNLIRPERARPSRFQGEVKQLTMVNRVYVKLTPDEPMISNDSADKNARLPSVDGQMPGKCPHRVGEDRIVEDRIVEEREVKNSRAREGLGRFKTLSLSPSELEELECLYENVPGLIDKVDRYLANAKRTYDNHMALVIKIAVEDKWPKKRKPRDGPVPGDWAQGLTMAEVEAAAAAVRSKG